MEQAGVRSECTWIIWSLVKFKALINNWTCRDAESRKEVTYELFIHHSSWCPKIPLKKFMKTFSWCLDAGKLKASKNSSSFHVCILRHICFEGKFVLSLTRPDFQPVQSLCLLKPKPISIVAGVLLTYFTLPCHPTISFTVKGRRTMAMNQSSRNEDGYVILWFSSRWTPSTNIQHILFLGSHMTNLTLKLSFPFSR